MPLLLPSPGHLKQNPSLIPQAVERSLELAREGEELRAFVRLMPQRALKQAHAVKDALLRGEALPLGGWIIAVKDNIAIQGEPLSCASRVLDGYVSPYTATAVRRLEQAGAIIVGKTNLDEFAMGSSSENTIFGCVRHPMDHTRVPGGSSGGSAVSVAAGWVHGALGSDTGGSVRQPAAFCGIAGLKPTYGRVSRYGLVAFGSSLDQIAPFSTNCAGLFDLLCFMSGVDAKDSSSAPVATPVHDGGLKRLDRKLNIGLPVEYYVDGLSSDIAMCIERLIGRLRIAGHTITDVSLPHTKYAIPAYYILATAEASSNLARYDGGRYGWRSPKAGSVGDVYDMSRGEGFGREVRRRIMMGTFALSAGYYDAYYRKAQQVRRLIHEDFVRVFKQVDVVLVPTTPSTAFRIGEKIDDPLEMYLSDIFTTPTNLAGIPAVSVAAGVDHQGLPIGVQVKGPLFSEELILQLGEQIEDLVGESKS